MGDGSSSPVPSDSGAVDQVNTLIVNNLIIEVPGDNDNQGADTATSEKKPPRSRSDRNKKGGKGDRQHEGGDVDGKSPHSRNGPKSTDRKKRVDKVESGSQDGDSAKKHVFQGTERKAKDFKNKSPREGKGKKTESEATPVEKVSNHSLVFS